MAKDTQGKRLTSRDMQARERRQQILAAAKRLFAQNGYHATSMRAINKEVGMSEALTYHYFPGGKLEIFQTIIREGKGQKTQDIYEFVKAFQDEMSLREVLLLFGRKFPELFMDEEFTQIIIREKRLVNEQSAVLSQLTEPPLKFMVEFLRKRAAQGEIREMDFGLAVNQFVLTLASACLFGTEEMDYQQFMEQMVDFLIGLWSK